MSSSSANLAVSALRPTKPGVGSSKLSGRANINELEVSGALRHRVPARVGEHHLHVVLGEAHLFAKGASFGSCFRYAARYWSPMCSMHALSQAGCLAPAADMTQTNAHTPLSAAIVLNDMLPPLQMPYDPKACRCSHTSGLAGELLPGEICDLARVAGVSLLQLIAIATREVRIVESGRERIAEQRV